MAYQPNLGELPKECVIWDDTGEHVVGYRPVHVILWGGYDTRKAGAPPWPSRGGKGADTVWKLSRKPHPYEIREWEIA